MESAASLTFRRQSTRPGSMDVRLSSPPRPRRLGNSADPACVLASWRLAIVDVADGRQPAANEDGTVQVVFNGEIYNHRQIRRWLARRGHQFRSGSDVEVIPHLYEERGLDFVDELDGDFAIGSWDGRSAD